MSRHLTRIALLFCLFATLALTLHPETVASQAENLLFNPGFEEPYYRIATDEGGGAIAEGWTAWWYNDEGGDYSVPEYEVAPDWRDPWRVREGGASQQIFRPSVLWQAGVYQRVNVPANSHLQFTAYGHAWSGFCKVIDGGHDCGDSHDSNYGDGANPSTLKIGIDPTGGEDWSSSNVIWSADYNIHDVYQQLAVEATAQGDFVTVFTFTTFFFPAPVNNVYWDDAALIVIGGAPPPPPQPTVDPNATPGEVAENTGPVVVITQPANPFGAHYHVVQNGETLDAIAAAYDMDPQVLRDLNEMAADEEVAPGRVLVISLDPAGEAATPANPTQEAQATQVAEAFPTTTGQICPTIFEDQNSNGVLDSGEPQLARIPLELTGPITASVLTDGTGQRPCFRDLEPGEYTISVAAPDGFTLTTGASQQTVVIDGAASLDVDFGAVAAPRSEQGSATGPTQSAFLATIPLPAQIMGAVGLACLLVALGGIGVTRSRGGRRSRRRDADDDHDDTEHLEFVSMVDTVEANVVDFIESAKDVEAADDHESPSLEETVEANVADFVQPDDATRESPHAERGDDQDASDLIDSSKD